MIMKVKDLLDILKTVDQERVLIIAINDERGDHAPVESVSVNDKFFPSTNVSGIVFDQSDKEAPEIGGVLCITLWPAR